MTRRINTAGSVTASLADAERRLLDVLSERPTVAERLCKAIAAPRSLMLAASFALGWLLVNRALALRAGIELDPFPFRWLQRVLVVGSLSLAMIAARANGDRGRRGERLLAARRDLEETARCASISRTLQIMQRPSSANEDHTRPRI